MNHEKLITLIIIGVVLVSGTMLMISKKSINEEKNSGTQDLGGGTGKRIMFPTTINKMEFNLQWYKKELGYYIFPDVIQNNRYYLIGYSVNENVIDIVFLNKTSGKSIFAKIYNESGNADEIYESMAYIPLASNSNSGYLYVFYYNMKDTGYDAGDNKTHMVIYEFDGSNIEKKADVVVPHGEITDMKKPLPIAYVYGIDNETSGVVISTDLQDCKDGETTYNPTFYFYKFYLSNYTFHEFKFLGNDSISLKLLSNVSEISKPKDYVFKKVQLALDNEKRAVFIINIGNESKSDVLYLSVKVTQDDEFEGVSKRTRSADGYLLYVDKDFSAIIGDYTTHYEVVNLLENNGYLYNTTVPNVESQLSWFYNLKESRMYIIKPNISDNNGEVQSINLTIISNIGKTPTIKSMSIENSTYTSVFVNEVKLMGGERDKAIADSDYWDYYLLLTDGQRVYKISVNMTERNVKSFSLLYETNTGDFLYGGFYYENGYVIVYDCYFNETDGVGRFGTQFGEINPVNDYTIYSKMIEIFYIENQKYDVHITGQIIKVKHDGDEYVMNLSFKYERKIEVRSEGDWYISTSVLYTVDNISTMAFFDYRVIHIKKPNIGFTYLYPDDGSVIVGNSVKIRWSGQSLYGIDRVRININNKIVKNISGNSGSYVLNVSDIGGFNNMTIGGFPYYSKQVTVNITLHDIGDFNYSKEITFTMVKADLHLKITKPVDNRTFNTNVIPISWEAFSTINIDYYQIRIDDGNWKQVGLSTYYVIHGLSSGEHLITVSAKNESYNISAMDTVKINVKMGGEFKILSPIWDECFQTNKVDVWWYSNQSYSDFKVKVDNGTYRDVGTLLNTTIRGLSNGKHMIYVKETINKNEYIVRAVEIYIGYCIPEKDDFEIWVKSPEKNAVSGTGDVKVDLIIKNSTNLQSLYIYLNGKDILNKEGTEKEITYTIPNLKDGRYILTIVGYGKYGNVHSYSMLIKVKKNTQEEVVKTVNDNGLLVGSILLVGIGMASYWVYRRERK